MIERLHDQQHRHDLGDTGRRQLRVLVLLENDGSGVSVNNNGGGCVRGQIDRLRLRFLLLRERGWNGKHQHQLDN
ncbi:hypothetical protein D3C86_2047790 [compost metagenome]